MVLDDVELGASIAVNGCCLTVVGYDDASWSADAVIETLARTNLGDLAAGAAVNLERPVRLSDRLGGHMVQGHVDATGTIRGREPQPDGSELVTIAAPAEVMRYIVHKGSITVDGVSLTVVRRTDDSFSIALIPHTLAVTTLGQRPAGSRVNLEADLIAKYVEALMPSREEVTP
jgi:riboflavin synthase